MFGNVRNQMIRRNLPQMPGDVSGYGGGTWNTDGTQATPMPAQQGGYTRPQRGTAQRVAGYLADALAGLAGQQGPYASMLFREQQMGEAEAMRQRQRAEEYTDWQKRQQWELANKPPTNNDTVADYEFIRSTLGDDQAREFLRNKANPPQYRLGADGVYYRVQTGEAPARPVGRLTPIEEGGAGNGAGGFPIR